jgi:hypothetical protein
MLHIPNLTKHKENTKAFFALQCQNAKNAVENFGDCYRSKSTKSATIRKLQKMCKNNTRPVSKCSSGWGLRESED